MAGKLSSADGGPVRRGIPSEILRFFETAGGHSMILKGAPGTGKTTFALQLAEELSDIASSFYLSARVSDETLHRQFPWLRERMEKVSLEFARPVGPPPAKPPEEGKPKVDRTELAKLEGRIERGEEGDETYDKVGEGQVAEGSLWVDIGSDLPEVDMAYDAVDRNLPRRSLLMIDSIDALSERYGVHPSKLINTLQRDLVENSNANVLYVLESSSETRLDYLGDGVVVLSSEAFQGRRIRVMTIEKLRGSEIRQYRYLYTLDGGRVRAFDIRGTERVPTPAKWTAVPDPSRNVVSTGHEALDRVIGGFPRGSIVALDVASNVPPSYVDDLRTGFVANFVVQGRGVVHVPPRRGTAEAFKEVLSPYLEPGGFEASVRVFESSGLGSVDSPKGALHMEGQHPDSDLKWSNVEYHLPKASKPLLSLMSFDTLESVYGAKVLEQMSAHIASVRRARDIFVGLSNPLLASNDRLGSMAHVHVKVANLNGSIVLYGEKPFTEIFNLDFTYDGGVPKAELTPIL